MRLRGIVLVTTGLIAACSPPIDPPATPAPAIERSLVDGVEVVRNLGGSVWGELQLELIAQIGSEESEEYLFSQLMGFWATDEMVLVADFRSGLRAFDRSGRFLRQYGRPGQGPGEYESLFSVAVLSDGRVVAQGFPRVSIYAPDGTPLEDWHVPIVDDGYQASLGPPFVITPADEVLWRVRSANPPFSEDPVFHGYRLLGPDGWSGYVLPVPDPGLDVDSLRYPCPGGGGDCSFTIPYQARASFVVLPDRRFVTGTGDEYAFTVIHADGSQQRVERVVDPQPVTELERRVWTRGAEARVRLSSPGYRFDAGRIPAHKPAFLMLLSSQGERIFVARETVSLWNEDLCGPAASWDPTPEELSQTCLDPRFEIDIFAADGTFLGYFERPAEVRVQRAYIDDEEFWTYAEDEMGNPVVRGYRIVTPDTPEGGG